MTRKLMLYGLKERLKVYAGIVLLYLLYLVGSKVYQPTPQMNHVLDWFFWSYEVMQVKVDVGSFLVLGMAVAALLVAEIIIFARDFYTPQSYLLFSLPVNGRNVIGSRLGLFLLDFLMLGALDLPVRLQFYRQWYTSATSGELASFSPWMTPADTLYLGILQGSTWILTFTLVPLLSYLLIAAAKSLFDLSAGWLTAFLALGYGVVLGVSYGLSLVMPPLIHISSGSEMVKTNPWIPVLLVIANVLVFWAGTKVIDKKLNI